MAFFNAPQQTEGHSRSFQLFRAILMAFEVGADFATAFFAVDLSYYLAAWATTGAWHATHLSPDQQRLAVFVGLTTLLLLKVDGAYRETGSLLKIRETERSLRASLQACFLLIPVSLVLGVSLSWRLLAFTAVCLPICEGFQKQCMLRGTKWLHTRGIGVQRTIVYGAGSTGRRLLSAIWASPKLGWQPILVIDDDPELWGQQLLGLGYRRSRVGEIAAGPITEQLLTDHGCDLLIIAVPRLSQEKFEAILTAARNANVRLAVLSDRSIPINESMHSVDIDGLFLLTVGTPLSKSTYAPVKRVFDICMAVLLIITASPLFLIIAALIKLESPGNVFFKQERIGTRGRPFMMWKFRSMHREVLAYEISPATPMDPRITKVGRFLRKTSFDELPQLINVLIGEMSLVGPRPEMPFLVAQYNSFQRERLQVIPGITGLWQLSADRAHHIHENIQYDLYYIRNRGFFMDLAILFHTVLFAVRGI